MRRSKCRMRNECVQFLIYDNSAIDISHSDFKLKTFRNWHFAFRIQIKKFRIRHFAFRIQELPH
jgi:hypothetical protein